MAVELNKFALAGIGAVEKLRQKLEDLVEGAEVEDVNVEETSETKEKKSFTERFDDLVEIGEEKYDGFMEKVKEERGKVREKIEERLGAVFTDIGLITREDLEVIEGKIRRLERKVKSLLK
ncbi:MAG: phasin family protein [bacterium]